MEGRIARQLGKATLAAAVAFGGGAVAGVSEGPSSVDAAARACVGKTTGFAIEAGQTRTFKAKDAIVTGDVFVNGVRNYDDLAETGAVNVMKSETCKTWKVEAPFGASVVRIADSESNNQVLIREAKATNKMASTGGHRAADVYLHR